MEIPEINTLSGIPEIHSERLLTGFSNAHMYHSVKQYMNDAHTGHGQRSA